MNYLKKTLIKVPFDELKGVEDMFYRQVQMEEDRLMRKFYKQYLETKELCYSKLEAEAIYSSLKIEKIKDDVIYCEKGIQIPNHMLAEVFNESDQICIFAETIHGYEDLEKENDNVINQLFLDGWGTALAECGAVWLKEQITELLKTKKIYTTCSWSPGQHSVDITLQHVVFNFLHPEEIGIELNKSCMMHPKKSISGFIGLGNKKDNELKRACDFCEHRENCPSAYV